MHLVILTGAVWRAQHGDKAGASKSITVTQSLRCWAARSMWTSSALHEYLGIEHPVNRSFSTGGDEKKGGARRLQNSDLKLLHIIKKEPADGTF